MLQDTFSFWTPAIEMFPTLQDFELYHPVYAEEKLLDAFKFLPVVQEIRNKLQTCTDLWSDLQHVIQEAKSNRTMTALSEILQEVTFEDFKWAHTVWQTRASESELAG